MQETTSRIAVVAVLTAAAFSITAAATAGPTGAYRLRDNSITVDEAKGISRTNGGLIGPSGCPADTSGLTDPWLLVSTGDASVRPADRNGDGQVCGERGVRRRFLVTVATDNAIGNPGIIPPGPCTGPFVPMSIGKPARLLPWLREIDTNGDGTLCGTASSEPREITFILLDNPNAFDRPSTLDSDHDRDAPKPPRCCGHRGRVSASVDHVGAAHVRR